MTYFSSNEPEEFNLRDKINKLVGSWEGLMTFDKMRLKEEILQVFKEFIKKLKEELCSDKVYCGDNDGYSCEEVKKIDKLAGKELINSQSDIKQLNEGERANE